MDRVGSQFLAGVHLKRINLEEVSVIKYENVLVLIDFLDLPDYSKRLG